MQELPFLRSARRLMLIDICMKFREDSFRGFQLTEQTRFVTDRRTDGRTDRRPGKNNMSPNPSGGDIQMQMEKQTVKTPIRLLRSSLIWVCTICPDQSVRKLKIITIKTRSIMLSRQPCQQSQWSDCVDAPGCYTVLLFPYGIIHTVFYCICECNETSDWTT